MATEQEPDSSDAALLALAKQADEEGISGDAEVELADSTPAQDKEQPKKEVTPESQEQSESEAEEQKEIDYKAEYERLKKEEERKDRSWKRINEEKEALAKLKQIQHPEETRYSGDQFSAEEYEKYAEKLVNEGDTEGARSAMTRSKEIRQKAFVEAYQRSVNDAIDDEPDLANSESELAKAVQTLIKDPSFGGVATGFKNAVRLAKAEKMVSSIPGLQGEINKYKEEIDRLNKAMEIGGKPGLHKRDGPKKFEDMSIEEASDYLRNRAKEADAELLLLEEMAINTTTSLSNQYQRHYSKKMLLTVENTLVMNQFAKKSPLPKGLGAKTIRFFRRVAAASANVSTLTEGTPLATYTDLTYTAVDVDLVQLGELARFTDILGWTALLDVMNDGIDLLGEDCALKADDVTLAVIAHATTGGTKRYSGGAADFTALKALSNANGKFVATDGLDACTTLVINKAPRIDGGYVGIVGPQVARDLRTDSRWLNPHTYKDGMELYKYEIGSLDGVRYVQTTNVWGEDATEGTRDTSSPPVFVSVFTGKEGYGVVALDGQSPLSPKIIICDKADKSDGLNQFISVGWKAYYNAAMLNADWVIAVRSRSVYA